MPFIFLKDREPRVDKGNLEFWIDDLGKRIQVVLMLEDLNYVRMGGSKKRETGAPTALRKSSGRSTKTRRAVRGTLAFTGPRRAPGAACFRRSVRTNTQAPS